MNRCDTKALFKIKRIFSIESSEDDSKNSFTSLGEFNIDSLAVHTDSSKQYLALAIGSSTKNGKEASTTSIEYPSRPLIVRSIEEDGKLRFWRFSFTKCSRKSIDRSMPLCSSPTRRSSFPSTTSISASVVSQAEISSIEKSKNPERFVALDFSPEGDWLAALSLITNALYLIPIQSLIKKTRKHQVEKSYKASTHGNDSPNVRSTCGVAVEKGVMTLSPSVMNVRMSSYLRAKNEAGGCNGAKYRSQIANDNLLMSSLILSPDIGTLSCCRWWRSSNGKNYCLIGGTTSVISIVNIEENREECRCDLDPRLKSMSTRIESIELLHETVNKLPQCSMLIKMRMVSTQVFSDTYANENAARYHNKFATTPVSYFRVLLERHVMEIRSDDLSRPNGTLKIKTLQEYQHERLFSPQRMHNGHFVKGFTKQVLEDPATTPICLFAINGTQYSESWVAAYSAIERSAMLYLNINEQPKSMYTFPQLFEEVNDLTNVEMLYSSTDLMLLQGNLKGTVAQADSQHDQKYIAVWVSLPSRQVGKEDTKAQEARVVHHLRLHENEKIKAVLQTTSISKQLPKSETRCHVSLGNETSQAAGQTLYIIWTDHNVYECYTQWSRLALFTALREECIMLSDALCIGYALGVDMASLCEVVADTLCGDDCLEEPTKSAIGTSRKIMPNRDIGCDGNIDTMVPFKHHEWIKELYSASRVQPHKGMEQLRGIGANLQAIAFGKHYTGPFTDHVSNRNEILATMNGLQPEEARRVAELLIDLLMEQKAKRDFLSEEKGNRACTRRSSDDKEELIEDWLLLFLEQNVDYDFQAVIDICIHWEQVALALNVGLFRNSIEHVFKKILQAGMASSVSTSTIESLLVRNSQVAQLLAVPENHIILRQLPNRVQLRIISYDADTVLEHRDWIIRNSNSFSVQQCITILDHFALQTAALCLNHNHNDKFTDVDGICEKHSFEEAEFYLALLIRVVAEIEKPEDPKYSQWTLQQHIKSMKGSYRPSIILTRCVDYQNWNAAAEVFEAHDGWIDAVECRLRCHSILAEAARSDFTKIEPNDLLCLIQRFVQEPSINSSFDQETRESIFSRILVKWYEFGFSMSELEIHILDEKNFCHLQPLLSSILYSEVSDQVKDIRMGFERKHSSSDGLDTHRNWLAQCRDLPFSGRLLYRISLSLVKALQAQAEHIPTKARNVNEMVDVVRGSILDNDRMISAIEVPSHLSRLIGKSDPLETHVEVFSCGHLFPKRVLEEDILPEFETRMNALSLPLFRTKILLIEEWRKQNIRGTSKDKNRQLSDYRSGTVMEVPCPLCCYSYLCWNIEEQDRQCTTTRDVDRIVKNGSVNPKSNYYYIHAQENKHLSPSVYNSSNKAFVTTIKIEESTKSAETK